MRVGGMDMGPLGHACFLTAILAAGLDLPIMARSTGISETFKMVRG
jgi:hypothetical protein